MKVGVWIDIAKSGKEDKTEKDRAAKETPFPVGGISFLKAHKGT